MLTNASFKLAISLFAAGFLVSCQAGVTLQSTPGSQLPSDNFADLEAEYAPFSTQALTQNYLERKVKHWVVQNNGEAMRREVEFSRRKHPALLSSVLSNNALCNQVGAFPEVAAYKNVNPDFSDYVSSFACSAPAFVGEFQLATQAGANYSSAQVISDSGRFLITWSGNTDGTFAQRFTADGSEIGGEFLVNTVPGRQILPSIALDNSGGFVVTWTSRDGQDGSADGIFARRFAANGSPIGNEFQVNTYTDGFQQVGHIAMDNNGNFVITWQSEGQDGSGYGIYARRFAANGTPIGNEFQVNTYTENRQLTPAIAMNHSGDFVITWQSEGQDGSGYGLYAQRFAADGSPIGSEFQVHTGTENAQMNPAIAMEDNGDFVITWQSEHSGAGTDIFAQRFAANGSSVGNEFQINAASEGDHRIPSLAMDQEGNFVISWGYSMQQQEGSVSNVFARRFAADGSPIGNDFQVNTSNNNSSYVLRNSLAMNAQGDFIISWARITGAIYTAFVRDTVLAQRYNAQGEPQ